MQPVLLHARSSASAAANDRGTLSLNCWHARSVSLAMIKTTFLNEHNRTSTFSRLCYSPFVIYDVIGVLEMSAAMLSAIELN